MKLSDIKPNPNNPRLIKDDKFKKLVQSVKDFPEMLDARPLILNKDNVILGGNMRFKAAKEAGFKDIPVKIVDWDEDKQREFIIKDNVSGGEWDWDLLANEWDAEELDDWGLDIPADLEPETEVEEDEAPEVSAEPPVSKLGEIYQLGKHRVLCGDSTDKANVELLMNGEKADMVFTDPPYGVSYTGGLQNTKSGLRGNAREMIDNDDIDLYEKAVDICAEYSNGVVFMFYADTVPFGLYRGIEKVKGEIVALIIWKKKGGYGALGASYKANHEPCLVWKPKGKSLNFIGSTTENRVWEMDKEGLNKLHPTQKPVAVPARAIQNHKANTVLDLFLGSGSTLIACEQTDRTCYGMELDPKYVDVIRKRYAKFTNPNEWEESWEQLTPAINSES